MRTKAWDLLFLGCIVAYGPMASGWELEEEWIDVTDEIEELARAIPEYSEGERWRLGKEVRVTLPQLADRLTEIAARLEGREGAGEPYVREIVALRQALMSTRRQLDDIEDVERDEFVAKRAAFRQNLQDIATRMSELEPGGPDLYSH